MTDLRQVAQQALDALREFGYHGSSPRWERTANALKTALEQPEPVACRFCHSEKGCWAWQCYKCGEIDDVQQPAPLPVQKPLTHDEIEAIGDKVANEQLVGPVANFRVRFTRAIEAAHRIKDSHD